MTPTHAQTLHTLPITVHIFDTDCYGVMWHGAYIKWLEMGRVELFRAMGVELSPPEDKNGVLYPVVEQTLRFFKPARLNDRLTLTTQLHTEKRRLIFTQTVLRNEDQETVITARTTCVAVDAHWRLLRELPVFCPN